MEKKKLEKAMEWYLAARALQGNDYEPDTASQCTSAADICGIRRALMPSKDVNAIRCIAGARRYGRVHARYMLEWRDYDTCTLRMQRLPEDKLDKACRVVNEINSRFDIGQFSIAYDMHYPCLEVDYNFTGDAMRDSYMLSCHEDNAMKSLLIFVPLICMACSDDYALSDVLEMVDDANMSLPGLKYDYDLYMEEIRPDGKNVLQSPDDLPADDDETKVK